MKSKYVRTEMEVKILPNQWRETQISETWMREIVAPLLQQLRFVRSSSEVERVVLSDLKDGKYTLTYSVSRRKED